MMHSTTKQITIQNVYARPILSRSAETEIVHDRIGPDFREDVNNHFLTRL